MPISPVVGKVFGLISLVVALVGPLYLMSHGLAGGGSSQQASDASQLLLETRLVSAAREVEEQWRGSGTYAGAVLSPELGVRLVRADGRSYCLELATENTVWHQLGPANGPGGSIAPGWSAAQGACPRQ